MSASDLLTGDGLAKFSAAAAAHVGDDKVPGLVALVARGDQVHVEALGSLSIGGPPVRRDSLFRIASTSKPITAAVTLALVSEGLLTLDEPVDRLVPELAEPAGVAPDGRAARRQRSGQSRHHRARSAHLHVRLRHGGRDVHGTRAVAGRGGRQRNAPVHPRATDSGRAAGAGCLDRGARIAAAARTAGRALALQHGSVGAGGARCPGPPACPSPTCSARGSSSRSACEIPRSWTSDIDRLATAYVPTADGLQVWDPPDGDWSRPPSFGDGAAGLVSTVDDLLAFARMLRARRGAATARRRGRGDDPRPADPGTEERRTRLPRRARLGILSVGNHRWPPSRRLRLGRRARHVVAGRPDEGPHW